MIRYSLVATTLPVLAAGRGGGQAGHLALQIRSRVPEVTANMKFQALLTLYPAHGDDPVRELGPAPRRMVLRASNDETHQTQVFCALVNSDDGPLRPGGSDIVAIVRVNGDDVGDYLDVGGHFDLWLGDNVGQGVITRRLFV